MARALPRRRRLTVIVPTAVETMLLMPKGTTRSAVVICAGSGLAGREFTACRDLVGGLLQRGAIDIILHGGPQLARHRDVIGRECRLSSDQMRRFAISDAPLGKLLPDADFLVSFTAVGLVAAARSGLRPMQIGEAVAGTAAFSDIFPDVGAFIGALANGRLRGRLSLPEYAAFEAFCAELQRRCGGWLVRDPLVHACRSCGPRQPSVLGTVISAIVNPVAAWRLVLGSYRAPKPR